MAGKQTKGKETRDHGKVNRDRRSYPESTPLLTSEHNPNIIADSSIHVLNGDKRKSGLRKALYVFIFLIIVAGFVTFAVFIFGHDSQAVPKPVKIKTLPEVFIPNSGDANGKDGDSRRRLILIGDVHGNYYHLRALEKKVKADPDRDHIILLGDFVTKGRHPEKVVNHMIDWNMSCVMGNHEDKLMSIYSNNHKLSHKLGKNKKNKKNKNCDMTTEDCLADNLSRKLIEKIASCPYILRLGDINDHTSEMVAVHGGLMWNVPHLANQDEEVVTNLRTVLPPDNSTASDGTDGIHWATVWNDKQKELKKKDRVGVIYGHYASQDLDIREFTYGLDSRCIKRGRLTALVITQKKSGKWKYKLESISCADRKLGPEDEVI